MFFFFKKSKIKHSRISLLLRKQYAPGFGLIRFPSIHGFFSFKPAFLKFSERFTVVQGGSTFLKFLNGFIVCSYASLGEVLYVGSNFAKPFLNGLKSYLCM
jgi:hypothetical protein